VNGEIVVAGGRSTRMSEEDVLEKARRSRERLNPAIQREMAAAQSMEPALAEMYFRVFGKRSS